MNHLVHPLERTFASCHNVCTINAYYTTAFANIQPGPFHT